MFIKGWSTFRGKKIGPFSFHWVTGVNFFLNKSLKIWWIAAQYMTKSSVWLSFECLLIQRPRASRLFRARIAIASVESSVTISILVLLPLYPPPVSHSTWLEKHPLSVTMFFSCSMVRGRTIVTDPNSWSHLLLPLSYSVTLSRFSHNSLCMCLCICLILLRAGLEKPKVIRVNGVESISIVHNE